MRNYLLLILGCSLLAAETPVFHSLVTSGWNEKSTVEFTVKANGTFVWRSGRLERRGSMEPAVLAELITHVQAAKPGPIANDVGTLQVTWHEKAGKPAFNKVFYFPGQMPASGLIQEIEAIATRYGKPFEIVRKP
jgi:hypothetical protein